MAVLWNNRKTIMAKNVLLQGLQSIKMLMKAYDNTSNTGVTL